jgi:hypothetical protein
MSIIFLPNKLDLHRVLVDNPPKFKCHVDELKYIIGLIIRLKSQHKGYLKCRFRIMVTPCSDL